MVTESDIVWQGNAVFVTYDRQMPASLGPYAICVEATTHAVIVGRTADVTQAVRCARRLDRYPANARKFAGIHGFAPRKEL